MQPLEKRIFLTLQQSQGEGIEELGLLGEEISGSYARKIKSKINKSLGDRGAIYVEQGIWYLHKEYWELQTLEMSELVLYRELNSIKNLIKWTIPMTVVANGILLILALLTLFAEL